MSQKHLVLLQLLPTTLRGFVPRMHEATCRLVEGLRLLDGQVHSHNRGKELCLDPTSRAGNYVVTITMGIVRLCLVSVITLYTCIM